VPRRRLDFQHALEAVHEVLPGTVVTVRPPTHTVGGLICAQPLSALDNDDREPIKRLILAFNSPGHRHGTLGGQHTVEATVDLSRGDIVQPDPHPQPLEEATLGTWDDLVGFLSVVRQQYKLTLNGLPPDHTLRLPKTAQLARETLDRMPYGVLHDKDKRVHLGAHAGMHGADGLPTISLIREVPNKTNKTEAIIWAQLLRVADEKNPLARAFGPHGLILSPTTIEAKALEGTAQWALGNLNLLRSIPT
jgi:hypothetical protein